MGLYSKTIQWHIHAGSWSLVNCWREGKTLPYKGCSWILMNAAVGHMDGSALMVIGVSAWYPDRDKVIFSEACVKNSVHIREQCMLGDTGNKRAVRILLECILVYCNSVSFTDVPTVTQLVRRHGLQPVLHSRRKNHVKVIAKYYLLILNVPSPSIRNVNRDHNWACGLVWDL